MGAVTPYGVSVDLFWDSLVAGRSGITPYTLFDSAAFEKLFGSACYDGSALWSALDMRPRWTLSSAMPDIVAAFRAQQTG